MVHRTSDRGFLVLLFILVIPESVQKQSIIFDQGSFIAAIVIACSMDGQKLYLNQLDDDRCQNQTHESQMITRMPKSGLKIRFLLRTAL